MDKFLIKRGKKSLTATISTSELETSVTSNDTTTSGNSDDTSNTDAAKEAEQGQQKSLKGRTMGRTYQASWKVKFPWIAYDANKNKVFCDVCVTAKDMKAPLPQSGSDSESVKSFVQCGFGSWGKAIERFRNHEKSTLHRASSAVVAAAKSNINVATQISAAKQKQIADARKALLAIFSSIQYLMCQGLSIRGKTDEDSNIIQLLKVRAQDIPELKSWLAQKENKWLSHDILNEMIEIMAHDVLRTLLKEIKSAEFFAVILDETSDITVKEQVSICLRFINDDLEPEEVFVGFYETASTTADALFQLLQDALIRLSLPFSKCRGQCYDGASNVSGVRNGLQARVQQIEPRAQYTHCTAHVLNLVVHDVTENIVTCRNFMTLIRDLITLIRNSPKRLAWFQQFQRKDSPSLRPLCPTRWTLTTASLRSIAGNYGALLTFLEDLALNDKSETGGKANGLAINLQKFGTYFSLHLMLKFFSRVETVSIALQKKQLHMQKARQMIDTLRDDIKSFRQEGFSQLWKDTVAAASELQLESPAVPRPRKRPRRLEDGNALEHSFTHAEDFYRQLYFEIIDTAATSLDCRFSPSVFKYMHEVEDFVTGKGDCKTITEFHGDDLDETRLKLHRDMCIDFARQQGIHLDTFDDVVSFLKCDQGKYLRDMLPEMTKLIKLALTSPVTSCTSERSFSSLRRLKSYLRSTMGQARLNHATLLNCHKTISRQQNLDDIANEFIRRLNNTLHAQAAQCRHLSKSCSPAPDWLLSL
ncbi:hypothetical protein WMY93_008199 [Mugilogobius chulae]|uniref:TTF-type domain-containing protein n=1 Tax=Mugilogobius chulae TaxID=88201 RepID=A0AAW0PU06_9GOBI